MIYLVVVGILGFAFRSFFEFMVTGLSVGYLRFGVLG